MAFLYSFSHLQSQTFCRQRVKERADIISAMEVDNLVNNKPEELGEEDLVDYEEEEEATVPPANKATDSAKETSKKYGH